MRWPGNALQDQAVTGSVDDALRMGCVAVGFTIYPGSDACYDQMEELREITREAKRNGPGRRGLVLPARRQGLQGRARRRSTSWPTRRTWRRCMGAHIIKVKPPTEAIDQDAAKTVYEKAEVPDATLADRIRHVMQACFNGKRLVVFSGGEAKDTAGILEDVQQIARRRRQRLDHGPQQLPAAASGTRSSSLTR